MPERPRHLPNPRTARMANTLDEATDLVSRNIYPHRLSAADARGRELKCLTSALDLGDCAIGYVQYGFNVEIDSCVIRESLLVKSTFSGHGRVTCGGHSETTPPRSLVRTSMTHATRLIMNS